MDDLIGDVIAAKYVQDLFSTQAKDDVGKMVKELMDSFSSLVRESSWMDEATKSNALLKASSMNVLVGHPDWMRNNTVLDKKYEEVIAVFNSLTKSLFKTPFLMFSSLTQAERAILKIMFRQKALVREINYVKYAKVLTERIRKLTWFTSS